MSESETNWGPAALRQAAAHIVQAAGSSPEEAKAVADNLVMANLKGHDSHGVGMLPRYM
ncbi:MAG: Ldh family oxidoreductase, partial [Burkholderiaceae bacterium]